MAKLAFIGLGVMGYPMAGHLTAAGHQVTVFNRTTAKAQQWVARHGGTMAQTPAEAARGAEFVFACVGADDDLRAVTTGTDGAFHTMGEGSIFIDNTTASAEVARELAAAAKGRGIGFIDAPVSGGQAGAEQGILTVMCGGEAADFVRAEPIIRAFGRVVTLIGGTGSGQQAKMVNQICIAGLVQGLAEGVAFGMKAGLDMEAVLETLAGGAAQSWQMVNRGKTMVAGEFDFGFAVDWMIKDLGICLAEAKAMAGAGGASGAGASEAVGVGSGVASIGDGGVGMIGEAASLRSGASGGAGGAAGEAASEKRGAVGLPITEQVLEFYKELSAQGHGRLDTSSLIKRLG